MYTCRLAITTEEPWTTLDPIYLGAIRSGRGTPDIYCLVENSGQPVMRLDVYGGDMGFADALIWKTWVVIGFADAVHFVSLDTQQHYSFLVDSYFGHLYPAEEVLLVASASELLCFDIKARLQWLAKDLGVDEVVVNEVRDGIVYGEGEWDPPGGWRAFAVSLRSGNVI